MQQRKAYRLTCGPYRLDLGRRTRIMGVVNVTPDSFSDGGEFYDPRQAIRHGLELAESGADIIDIGGESTRPFSEQVSAEDEMARVLPIIETLSRRLANPISIDTTKAVVASRAIEAGATMINDISALRSDTEMVRLAAKAQVPIVLMHMQGTPQNMQVEPHYDALVDEVRGFLADAVSRALDGGVSRANLLIDPGFGFGKTFQHNFSLLKHLGQFSDLDLPLVIGTSRKAFIRSTLKKDEEGEPSPQSPLVEAGTQATIAAAIMEGAHIVRVHDVASTRATVRIIDAIASAP